MIVKATLERSDSLMVTDHSLVWVQLSFRYLAIEGNV